MKVSIIIPTFNEETRITRTLQSITNQYIENPPEVIVVDGGSTDATSTLAKEFGVTVLTAPQRGKVEQLNYGAEKAQGDILCFIDADTVLPDRYLTRILRFFSRHPNVVACSTRFKYVNGTLHQWHLGHRTFTLTGYEPLSWIITAWYVVRDLFNFTELPGCNMCVRQNAFLAIGGIPPVQLNEGIDAAFSYELRRLTRRLGRGRLRFLLSPPVLTSARHLSWKRSSTRLKQIHRYIEQREK